MKSPVITVKPDVTLAEVARLFQEKNFSGAPVVNDEGEMVGIVSEHDLLRRSQELRVASSRDPFGWVSPHTTLDALTSFTRGLCTVADTKVEEIMTRKVVSVRPEEPLENICRLMLRRKINRVPVVDGGKLVGIISRDDLVWAMVNLCDLKPGVLS
jgi:CBS domain-containing protein